MCPFNWNNETQFLLRMENISQEEEVRYLQEQDKYKDRLLANVSHDLRTPLNAISYLIARARDSKTKALQVQDLDMALINCDLLMSFINDILDYCQIKDNKLRLNMTTFSLKELLSQIFKLMKTQTQLKGLQFIILCKNEIACLNTDIRRVKQILINLLSNAIKFTEEGSIKLKATVSKDQNKVKFSVTDTGSGIEEEKLKNLGQPYQTFSTATNKNQSGIGLGLNLCKQLLSMLGPNTFFRVETKLNIGTKFSFTIYQNLDKKNEFMTQKLDDLTFSLPSMNSEIDQSEDIKSDNNLLEEEIVNVPQMYSLSWKDIDSNTLAQSPNIFKKDFTILIVDDNVFNLLVLKSQLQKMNENFNIIQANNGKQAIEKFCSQNSQEAEHNIKLIIMDCEMPMIDGYEATITINKKIKFENYQQSLIIGYTAMLGNNEERKCLQAGMCDAILKPASFNDLRDKIFLHFCKLLQ